MLTKKDILNLYEKYEVQATKRFGQNFLHNHNVIEKIIIGSKAENKNVVEIGPGLGSLTIPLLKVVKSLVSYEIDLDMIKVIEGEIKDKKFTLAKQDFLEVNFDWEGKKSLIANIPYNITSAILFKVYKNINKFDSATIMVQKEVGQRLISKPNTKSYGKLSVTTQLLADVEEITLVPPSSFIPSPKVDSIVVKLNFKKEKYNKELFDFIKKCFSQQRKKLTNNLKGFIEKEKIEKALQKLNLKDTIRPQEISPNLFLDLFKLVYN